MGGNIPAAVRRVPLGPEASLDAPPPDHCSVAGGDVSPGARCVHARPVVIVCDGGRVALSKHASSGVCAAEGCLGAFRRGKRKALDDEADVGVEKVKETQGSVLISPTMHPNTNPFTLP